MKYLPEKISQDTDLIVKKPSYSYSKNYARRLGEKTIRILGFHRWIHDAICIVGVS